MLSIMLFFISFNLQIHTIFHFWIIHPKGNHLWRLCFPTVAYLWLIMVPSSWSSYLLVHEWFVHVISISLHNWSWSFHWFSECILDIFHVKCSTHIIIVVYVLSVHCNIEFLLMYSTLVLHFIVYDWSIVNL